MSKREDEYWANEKDGLLYCAKHGRYYQAEFGCQLCYLEKCKNELNDNKNVNTDKKESQTVVRQFNYYRILEVAKNATQDEIKKAYLKLAKVYHPDVNPNPEAQEKFKKINEAYGILANSVYRDCYDNSPAECPLCWTHEVIETIQDHWRCRHCGCKFNSVKTYEVIELIKQVDIDEKLKSAMNLFQTTQCSFCKNFYTQPFLCPFRKLKSSCMSFNELDKQTRENLLNDEKWWWRMKDMIQQVQDNGILGKCRSCGALNPNPQEYVCWQCGKNSLCCPKCQESPILRYNIQGKYWKCASAGCGKKFTIKPKNQNAKQTLSKEICPNCKKNLYYNNSLLYWECIYCNIQYTYKDLFVTGTSKVEPDYDRLKKIRDDYDIETRERNERKKQQNIQAPFNTAAYTVPHASNISASQYKRKCTKIGTLAAVKTLLVFLVLFSIAFICWSIYLIYNAEMSELEGSILLVFSIVVLFWNINTLKKRRIGIFTVVLLSFSVLLIGCISSAFSGIEPFSSILDNMIQFF